MSAGVRAARGTGTLEAVSDARIPVAESASAHPAEVGGETRETTGQVVSGLGRVLIAVYIILAIAATARSIYQIIAKYDEAPLAYTLSAVSGIVYILATVALVKRNRPGWRAVAWGALCFELAGVLVVGTLSIVVPEHFAHPTVWSYYGDGYMWIPLALPIIGLVWLTRDGKVAPEPNVAGSTTGSLY